MVEPDLKLVAAGDWDPNDAESFGRMYETHFARVYNYIRYRVSDAAAADDLTSATFHKALDHRFEFDPRRAAISTWLLTIARNTVHDHQRSRSRRRLLLMNWWRGHTPDHPDPESILIGDEERDGLLAALAELPDRERDLLGLKFAGGDTNRAIAAITGLSESNVGVIVHRALGKLRVLLEAERKRS
jgi:RNA polymerase sigma-70 factor (ECF subfamily)